MSFTSPGSIGSQMPASEDTQLRRLRDVERFVTELGPSIARSFNTTIADLTNRAVLAKADAALVAIPVVSGSVGIIVWSATPAAPEITITSPYESALVTFGAAMSNTAGTSNPAESVLGLRVDGAIPDDSLILHVSSDQPSAGGAIVAGSISAVIALTPGVPKTIALAYGTRQYTATSTGDAQFQSRFITVTPIPTAALEVG